MITWSKSLSNIDHPWKEKLQVNCCLLQVPKPGAKLRNPSFSSRFFRSADLPTKITTNYKLNQLATIHQINKINKRTSKTNDCNDNNLGHLGDHNVTASARCPQHIGTPSWCRP